jgi:hypothetical protein
MKLLLDGKLADPIPPKLEPTVKLGPFLSFASNFLTQETDDFCGHGEELAATSCN